MIFEDGGRSFSRMTKAEQEEIIRKEFESFSPDEQEVFLILLEDFLEKQEGGQVENSLAAQYEALTYQREPVDMRTFVMDEYYLGEVCQNTFPVLLDDITEVFSGDYREVIFTGGIGTGKTYICSIGMCRLLYELSCMHSPQESFGLTPETPIILACISASEDLAKEVALKNIVGKIGGSPYFREHFPFKITQRNIRFPNNVTVVARATTPQSMLGMSVIGALVDECLHPDSKILLADGDTARVEDLMQRQGAPVVTFDWGRQRVRTAPLFVKRSTDQECFELVLDSGQRLRASWNHPVALRRNGLLGFYLVRDIVLGDEVVTFQEDCHGPEAGIQRSTSEEALRGREASNEGEELVLREEAQRSLEEAYVGGASRGGAPPTIRRSQEEALRGDAGSRGFRGDAREAVEGCETALGGRGVASTASDVRRGQSYVWPASYGGAEGGDLEGATGTKGLEDDSREAFSGSKGPEDPHRRVQGGAFREESGAQRRLQAHRGDEAEGLREQRVESAEGRLPISGVRRDGEGRSLGSAQYVGGEGCRTPGGRRGGGNVPFRSGSGSISVGGEPPVHASGLQGREGYRPSASDRGEAEGLHLQPEGAGEAPGYEGLLRRARLGLRGMGRALVVGRVVEAKRLGVCPTYDVHVPEHEVLIADGCLVHNTNFMPKRRNREQERHGLVNMAKVIYDNVKRRMFSRYGNRGKLFLPSSKSTIDSFISDRISEARTNPTIFVRDYSLWAVKPDDFSDKRFWVLCGNEQVHSRILDDDEYDTLRKDLPDRTVLIEVPEDVRGAFESDLEGSIRDMAGVATVAISPFIQRIGKIRDMIDPGRTHPFTAEVYDPSKPAGFMDSLLVKEYQERNFLGGFDTVRRPIVNPMARRVVHIDPALNGCAAGFAMAHVAGWKQVTRSSEKMESFSALAPIFYVDFVLQIVPPTGGDLDFAIYEHLVGELRRLGYPIVTVTADRWQCLVTGTLVNTARGLIPIEEVVPGDVVATRIGPRSVVRRKTFGKRPTLRLITDDGDAIEGTPHHRIEGGVGWVYSKGGKHREPALEWRRLDEFQVGDIVNTVTDPVDVGDVQDAPLDTDKAKYGWRRRGSVGRLDEWEPPEKMTPELAEWLGLIWGDGDIQKNGVRLTVGLKDEGRDLEDAKEVFRRAFGAEPACYGSGDNRVLMWSCRWLVRWLEGNKLCKPYVPEAILRSSRAVKASFLRGLFAADASVARNDGRVNFDTRHLQLADQVRILLRTEFGIVSRLITRQRGREGEYATLDRVCHVVGLRGPRRDFLERVGFSYSRKNEALQSHADVRGRRIFTRVIAIEESEGEVWDIEVEEDHSYVANGFVSHNSEYFLQRLEKTGISVGKVSMDRSWDPYQTLKQAIYEDRVSCYLYKPLLRELQGLEADWERRKVAKPEGGSKDVADSVAGALFTLATLRQTEPLPMMRGLTSWGDGGRAAFEAQALGGLQPLDAAGGGWEPQEPDRPGDQMRMPPILKGSDGFGGGGYGSF